MHLAILTPSSPGTTFAATELDFRVRDVTGYFLSAIDTPKACYDIQLKTKLNLKTPLKMECGSITITKQDQQIKSNHVNYHNKNPPRALREEKIKQNGLLVLVS